MEAISSASPRTSPLRSIGIDPSLTGTAVVVLGPDCGLVHSQVFSTDPSPTLEGRMTRYRELCARVGEVIGQHKPDIVVIEGYSFLSKGRGILDRIEYGGLLRHTLLGLLKCMGGQLIEVPPNTLKLFATGKGNADKLAVSMEVVMHYGIRFGTYDEFDAYGLARMGVVYRGWLPADTDYQTRAIESVRKSMNPQPKPRPVEGEF